MRFHHQQVTGEIPRLLARFHHFIPYSKARLRYCHSANYSSFTLVMTHAYAADHSRETAFTPLLDNGGVWENGA